MVRKLSFLAALWLLSAAMLFGQAPSYTGRGGGSGGSGTITGVTAGTGLSGGGTTGTVTVNLTSPVTRANGGLNSTSAGTGILRDGTTPAASELSGQVTTSGSNAATVLGLTISGSPFTFGTAPTLTTPCFGFSSGGVLGAIPCSSTAITVNGGSSLLSPINFQSGTNTTATNPSGSNVQFNVASAAVGTLGLIELNTDLGGSATAPTVVNGSHITNGSIPNSGLVTIGTAIGGTGISTSASNGVAQVSTGTWSVSSTLATGTQAVTQTPGDTSADVATDAFVGANPVSLSQVNDGSPTAGQVPCVNSGATNLTWVTASIGNFLYTNSSGLCAFDTNLSDNSSTLTYTPSGGIVASKFTLTGPYYMTTVPIAASGTPAAAGTGNSGMAVSGDGNLYDDVANAGWGEIAAVPGAGAGTATAIAASQLLIGASSGVFKAATVPNCATGLSYNNSTISFGCSSTSSVAFGSGFAAATGSGTVSIPTAFFDQWTWSGQSGSSYSQPPLALLFPVNNVTNPYAASYEGSTSALAWTAPIKQISDCGWVALNTTFATNPNAGYLDIEKCESNSTSIFTAGVPDSGSNLTDGVVLTSASVFKASGTGHVSADEINLGAVPSSALVLGSNSSKQPISATAANVATLVQGLTGCNTANFVFTPQASDCVAQTGAPALSAVTASTVNTTINNGNFNEIWQSATTTNTQTAVGFTEGTAATGTGDIEVGISTKSGSTALPILITAGGTSNGAEMTTAGVFQAFGGGHVNADQCNGGSCASTTPALSAVTALVSNTTLANGNNTWALNSATSTNSQVALTFGETTAATGTSDQEVLIATLAGSTAVPLTVSDSLTGTQTVPALKVTPTWNTSGVVDAGIFENVTNTASGAGSKLADLQVGGSSVFSVGVAGTTFVGASAPNPTVGTGGGGIAVEGTAFTGISGDDGWYANAANHCFDVVFQTVDEGCVLNASSTVVSNFTAHQFWGNNTASTTAPAAVLIGTSDVSPNAYVAGGGTAQAQTATFTPAVTALTTGVEVRWLPLAANTTSGPTLAVNGLTAKSVTKLGTAALVANDLTTTAIADAIYDGTEWQLQNPQTASAGGVTSIATTGPITGGTITTTGTIACATCVTSAAALTSTALMTGGGSQASQTPDATATLSAGGVLAGVTLAESLLTGSAAQTTVTETGIGHEITRAGVETANLTYPYVFTNANTTTTTTGSLGINTTGAGGTGQVPLIVNETVAAGDLADFYTLGTFTSGVFSTSGATKEFSFGATGNLAAAGAMTLGAANCTSFGTAGGLCATEGTSATNVSGTSNLYPDSTSHEWKAATNGSTSYGTMVRAQPGAIRSTALVASVGTATLCAASAGACNTAGTYHVHIALYQSGAACSANTTGGVLFSLTWTDANGTAHSAQTIPIITNSSIAAFATSGIMLWGATTVNAWGSGDINIDTNGTVIQYATTFSQCNTGTATYALSAVATRLQ
jgi:hypothetical protein